ncbi:hypothetical protein ANO14919_015400 [Xylariales sp. No.14919]|nr:hypothetical protein ANO14919_015400 [Xylariales sp. No.14919]
MAIRAQHREMYLLEFQIEISITDDPILLGPHGEILSMDRYDLMWYAWLLFNGGLVAFSLGVTDAALNTTGIVLSDGRRAIPPNLVHISGIVTSQIL